MYNKKESTEDYLEKILMLEKEKDNVRAIDIANFMNFSKASVSVALKKLISENYITVNKDTGFITLTKEGRNLAQETYDRHETLTKAFELLGIDPETAENDACKIEHLLSEKTFEAIKDKVNKVK